MCCNKGWLSCMLQLRPGTANKEIKLKKKNPKAATCLPTLNTLTPRLAVFPSTNTAPGKERSTLSLRNPNFFHHQFLPSCIFQLKYGWLKKVTIIHKFPLLKTLTIFYHTENTIRRSYSPCFVRPLTASLKLFLSSSPCLPPCSSYRPFFTALGCSSLFTLKAMPSAVSSFALETYTILFSRWLLECLTFRTGFPDHLL